MTSSVCDVVVVGAGPAGLAAAAAAARAGCAVTVIDADRKPGGQYWRQPAADVAPGASLRRGSALFDDLSSAVQARTTYLPRHEVWAAGRDHDRFAVHAVGPDGAVSVYATSVVLATGGYDRQLPFPGWDLLGVFTAGAAQALLKSHGVRVGNTVVVGGTGPFLLPVATDLAAHGARVMGVFEANAPARWASKVQVLARNPGRLTEAAGYAAALAKHRVRYRTRHAVVAAHGDDRVEAVTVARLDRHWNVVPGTLRTVACDAVAVGWGFTPRLELPLALGCSTRVDADGSLVTDTDARQATNVPGVYVAGEATGVGGADLAAVEGEIAGLAAASWTRAGGDGTARMDAGQGAVGHRRATKEPDAGGDGIHAGRMSKLTQRRDTLRAFAAAMHRVYPVRDGWQSWLRPDTLVCRCEEVTVAAVAEAVHELGATDTRSVKLYCRVGMGWCQGRICGYSAAMLTSSATGRPPDLAGTAERPIATPIRLADLADEPPPTPSPPRDHQRFGTR